MPIQMTAEEMQVALKDAEAALEADPGDGAKQASRAWLEYMVSMHVLGENTRANALALGYLDARELYPDMPRHSLEDFAKEFYAMKDPGDVHAVYARPTSA